MSTGLIQIKLKMKKLNRFLALIVALFVQISFAQDKTVSGNVSDESGMPLAGVNIIVQGSSSGTQSDFDEIIVLWWTKVLY